MPGEVEIVALVGELPQRCHIDQDVCDVVTARRLLRQRPVSSLTVQTMENRLRPRECKNWRTVGMNFKFLPLEPRCTSHPAGQREFAGALGWRFCSIR